MAEVVYQHTVLRHRRRICFHDATRWGSPIVQPEIDPRLIRAIRVIRGCPFLLNCASVLLLLIAGGYGRADEPELPYRVKQNVVYAEEYGIGLVMDVFTPLQRKNGRAVVEVTSGTWRSSRSKLEDLTKARVFDILCRRGYTAFAVRPGSIPKFTAREMVDHVERSMRWVKSRADQYAIDPHRIGLMGASAGGHVACLVAVANGRSTGKLDASVRAVGVFFPPTDFTNYGGVALDPRAAGRLGEMIRSLAFPEGLVGLTDEQIEAQLISISPARLVAENTPPFLLIHGGLDLLVPLQQSQIMLAALEEHNVPAQLIIKKGGGHPWPTIHEEVAVMTDWFDRRLEVEP